ncbi:MAG: hypothetical protein IK085_09610 [Clostridia bacterium]|nr:hypothetical protein [Clostridia bacterium]
MKCGNCSKDLPEGSQFCPYCLHKFTAEIEIIPTEIKPEKTKSGVVIITVAFIFVILFIILFALLHNKDTQKNGDTNTRGSHIVNAEETSADRFVEGEYYVTDENGVTSYPPATNVVVVDESGNIKQGYILPE